MMKAIGGGSRLRFGVLAAGMLAATLATAQPQPGQPASAAARPLAETDVARIGPALNLLAGKSTLLRFKSL